MKGSSRQAGFAALCLLSGSGWLLAQAYPSGIGFPLTGCIHFLLIGLIAAIVWLTSRAGRIRFKPAASIAIAGAGVFALPGIAAHLTAGAISQATSTALFCSIPLLTLLAVTAFDLRGPVRSQARLSSRTLRASVVGIGGVVLLLSADLPGTPLGWLYLGLLTVCCAAIAFAGIWMHSTVQHMPVSLVVAFGGLGSAALLASGMTGLPEVSFAAIRNECVRCMVFDLPLVWLVAWLIREVEPARLSARFLLVPAVTALEGYVVMRGGVDLRSAMGLAGMIVGGLFVLLQNDSEEVESLHLR